jgi:3-oxoacyl-[acyl-carrier-protein] synthase-3
MIMRIERITSHIPAGRASTKDIVANAGGDPLEARYFEKMFQMKSVSMADPDKQVIDYFDLLLDQLGPVDPELLPDTFIYVHAQPVADEKSMPGRETLRERPWLSAMHQQFELDQYNCASAFYAITLARRLMESGQSQRVMIFAGDSLVDWPLRYRYLPAVTLLGDAFFAMVLSNREGGLQILETSTAHYGEFDGGIDADPEELQAFNIRHSEMVSEALASVGHGSDDKRDILPHNINGLAWKMFAHENNTLRAPQTDLVAEVGHCCTADPFLLLDRLAQGDGDLDATLLSIGMGAYVGAAHVQGRLRPAHQKAA